MVFNPLQIYFLFGIIHNEFQTPVNIKFRPQLDPKLFYLTVETTEIVYNASEIEKSVERREIESVEHIIKLETTMIYVTNLVAKIDPPNTDELTRLLKRPYFDRFKEQELSGDFRSIDRPLGSAWMLFPAPESLITPDLNIHQGQKWSVKMTGGAFEINYELIKIDDEHHFAFIEGRNGLCLNGMAGNKRWNALWKVDTRTGIIKQLDVESVHQEDLFGKTTRKKSTKMLMREVTGETIFDYELEGDNNCQEL